MNLRNHAITISAFAAVAALTLPSAHAAALRLSQNIAAISADEPPSATETTDEAVGRSIGALDIARIRELFRITDTLGDELWPGFDTRIIPIAVNHDDRQEILTGHRFPPREFHPFDDHVLNGKPVMIRDGCTRYGPRGGGWAIDLGGEHAAYICTLQPDQTTEQYLSLLLHECFHVFQRWYRQRDIKAWADLPQDDVTYSAMLGLESEVLYALVNEKDNDAANELARMFVAVRQERRRDLGSDIAFTENEQEYMEGTPTYAQARLYQLMQDRGGLEPLADLDDPHYEYFADAGEKYREMVDGIRPPQDDLITFFHSQYNHGMAMGLALDRIRPGWKRELRETNLSPYALFLRQFPELADGDDALLEKAKERFGYEQILARQQECMDQRLATIRGYIDAPGRRYRIYHGEVRGRFNWKPAGPVYHVPLSLRDDPEIEAIIWAGGIHTFERGELLFESGEVPVIFRQDYLEWIDTEPAADGSDLVITSATSEGDVH
ncbi:MAG: hypothetical protein JSV91_03620, partial [Phycisphaerales bacterium]